MAEIMSTEKSYVDSLERCLVNYVHPLEQISKKKKGIVNQDQVRTLFSDIEMIKRVNEDLYQELSHRWEDWSPYQKIGDVFLEKITFLKIYSNYVLNYNAAMRLYSQLTTEKHFVKWLLEVRQNTNTVMDIDGYLIMPVQRIPRYNMLIADYIKHTWDDHQDYADLKAASEEIERVALYLNEKKRNAENLETLVDLASNIVGYGEELVVPSRCLIDKFQLVVSKKPRTLFLFNDILLITDETIKKNTTTYRFRNSIPIRNTMCNLLEEDSCAVSPADIGEIDAILVRCTGEVPVINRFVAAYNTSAEAIEISETNRQAALFGHSQEEDTLSVAERLLQRKNQTQDIKEKLDQLKNSGGNGKDRKKEKLKTLTELKVVLERQIEDTDGSEHDNLIGELDELMEKIETLKGELDPEDLEHIQAVEHEAIQRDDDLIKATTSRKKKDSGKRRSILHIASGIIEKKEDKKEKKKEKEKKKDKKKKKKA
eukprot:TRINITY_DN2546_c0_g1_i2.p1 TRINITY_DN2546_c0_g1~~TRINITY_DN2546_c0_g1_i2.p1  ORF type:complete len:484 (+),score=134.22 TRINITY_DN2546_c0_g1_i2:709-2160(+)